MYWNMCLKRGCLFVSAHISVHCHGSFHDELFLQFLLLYGVVDNLQKENFDMKYKQWLKGVHDCQILVLWLLLLLLQNFELHLL